MAELDYYEVLSISRDADENAIKKAYRKLAIKYHPGRVVVLEKADTRRTKSRIVDKNIDNKEFAEKKFKEIGEAYSVLSDPAKRKTYDLYGKAAANGASADGATYSAQSAEEIFQTFFGGQDPFSMIFEEALRQQAAGQRGGTRVNFGPGIQFQTFSMGGGGPQMFHFGGPQMHQRRRPAQRATDQDIDEGPPAQGLLRMGFRNTLLLFFTLWIFGVPLYMLWLLAFLGTYLGLI